MVYERAKTHITSSGFTLLEILVVISVIGILTGIGFYSFASYSKKQTIEQAAADLKTGIDQAKFNAISRVRPANCTGSLSRYTLVACSSTVTCTDQSNLYEVDAICDPAGQIINTASKKRPSNITTRIVIAECGTDGILRFYPLKNGIDIASCRIVLTATDSSLSKTLCVDAGGNVKIKDGTVSCP